MKTLTILGILILILSCTTRKHEVDITFNDVSNRGYSQSVGINTKDYKTLYISGQVSIDLNGNIVGVGNLEAQTEQVFRNIKLQIEKAGGTMNDLINMDCYFTDISKVDEFRKVRDTYINPKNPPASTGVQVERLAYTDLLIEISATAIIKLTGK